MKKPFPRALLILAGIIIGLALSVTLYAATDGSVFDSILGLPDGNYKRVDSDSSDTELMNLAYEVLDYIKDGDYRSLSRVAHPDYGVVFSPYATITLATNKCFQAEQLENLEGDSAVYVWGVYDGIGEPIELTAADYFAKFVFDKDYTAASVIGINHIVRTGNALENIRETFPDVRFIDFHIPDSGKENNENLDWGSLRLGFEEYGGELRLTLILHSGWTV